MNHGQIVQRHASISPNLLSHCTHIRQPLIAQANQVIRKFFNSCRSVTCYDSFTIVSNKDSLCGFADDDSLSALKRILWLVSYHYKGCAAGYR